MNMDIVNHKIVKNRIGLLNLAQELGDVSKACRIMGYSRDTFYRYKAAKAEGGIEAGIQVAKRKIPLYIFYLRASLLSSLQ